MSVSFLMSCTLPQIMSFSATYVVVLLQFRIGERADEALVTATPETN